MCLKFSIVTKFDNKVIENKLNQITTDILFLIFHAVSSFSSFYISFHISHKHESLRNEPPCEFLNSLEWQISYRISRKRKSVRNESSRVFSALTKCETSCCNARNNISVHHDILCDLSTPVWF